MGAYRFSTYNVFEPVVDPALHALGGLVGEGDGHLWAAGLIFFVDEA